MIRHCKNRQKAIFVFCVALSFQSQGSASLYWPGTFRGFRRPESARRSMVTFINVSQTWHYLYSGLLSSLCFYESLIPGTATIWKDGKSSSYLLFLQCRTGKRKLLLSHGKKKVHENFGNDWKAQEIFHSKISTETPIRNKFLPSCLILLEYTLWFYDSHLPFQDFLEPVTCIQVTCANCEGALTL